VGIEGVEEAYDATSGSLAQLSKSFVRYALACEYARIPIKRLDVAQKGVLHTCGRTGPTPALTANNVSPWTVLATVQGGL
jgi:hypothetical protein